MSETVMTVEDAAARFAELVERIHASGESATIVKAGQPVARIVPIPAAGATVEDLVVFLGRWRSDHPEPDEGFAAAIEESRRAIRPPRNPWE